MRVHLWLAIALSTAVLTGCTQDSVILAGPVVDELWLGPEVVATAEDLAALADLSGDLVLADVSGGTDGAEEAAAAVEAFGAGLLIDPGPSYQAFDLTLTGLYGSGAWQSASPDLEPDDVLSLGVLDLYRDHAALTLFGVDRSALGPSTQPNGM